MKITYGLLLAILILLSGCTHTVLPPCKLNPLQQVAKVKNIPYGVRYKLTTVGVKIFNQGDEYLLAVANSKIFINHTPRISANGYVVLNKIISYLKYFDKATLSVADFTDNVDSADRNTALTLQRTENVIDYLWSQKIDTRLVFAEGYGDTHQIASNATRMGRFDNQRLEFIFRRS